MALFPLPVDFEFSAIETAYRARDLAAMASILQSGADPNERMKNGNTPIIQSILDRYPDALTLFCQYANLDLRDAQGRTALHFVLENKDEISAQTLVGHGADTNCLDFSLRSPLYIAYANALTDSMQLLCSKKARRDDRTPECLWLIHDAVNKLKYPEFKTLLALHVNPNVRTHDGKTALLVVLQKKQALLLAPVTPARASLLAMLNAMIQDLITANADVDLLDDKFCSPLCQSLINGDLEDMRFLLEHGHANPNIKTPAIDPWVPGDSLLIRTVRAKRPDMTEILLSHGAAVDFQHVNSMTALHYAAETNSQTTAVLLLQNNCDKTLRDFRGKTAGEYAFSLGHTELSKIINSFELIKVLSGIASGSIRISSGATRV